jgi:hypothetical protein
MRPNLPCGGRLAVQAQATCWALPLQTSPSNSHGPLSESGPWSLIQLYWIVTATLVVAVRAELVALVPVTTTV